MEQIKINTMFKGVIRFEENTRNVHIKIQDLYGNVVKFTPNDIPKIIADLQDSINFTNKLPESSTLLICKKVNNG